MCEIMLWDVMPCVSCSRGSKILEKEHTAAVQEDQKSIVDVMDIVYCACMMHRGMLLKV